MNCQNCHRTYGCWGVECDSTGGGETGGIWRTGAWCHACAEAVVQRLVGLGFQAKVYYNLRRSA